jgi:RNA polymerase sigma factor (TIGR02999 family)
MVSPMDDRSHSITLCLQRLRRVERDAAHEMLPLLYDELRALAGHLMRGDRPDHTLQATALVHEAWLKVARSLDGGGVPNDRQHFLAVATTAMRQVLVNHARDRKAQKRGPGTARVPLDSVVDAIETMTGDVTAMNDVLERLAVDHPRPAQIVEMRVFGGMLVEEVAEALDLAPSTVKADWRFARAWLQRQFADGSAARTRFGVDADDFS